MGGSAPGRAGMTASRDPEQPWNSREAIMRFDTAGFEPESATAAGERHLAKIREADRAGPSESHCSTTEAIMVALALCNRAYLPKDLQQTHAGHLWWRLDDVQRWAVAAYGAALSKGGDEASASRSV